MVATHVLISRPEPEAAELAERVRTSGLTPVVMPAFRFHGLDLQISPDDAWCSAANRLAVFTSPRAVTFGLPCIGAGMLDDACIAALGPATRESLEAAGLTVDVVPPGRHDSEGLLAALPKESPPGTALILAAPGGRKALRDQLIERGWQVREAFVYERVSLPPDPAAIVELADADGVVSVWTSAQAMRYLLETLSPAARQPVLDGVFVVASGRLGELAGRLGAQRVRISDGAGNVALAAAVAQAIALDLT